MKHTDSFTQHGFGIIEVMVALALSAFLVLTAISALMANKNTYKTVESQSRIQESLSFSLNFLVNDLSLAGYFGCGGRSKHFQDNLNQTAVADGSLNVSIGVYDASNNSRNTAYRIEGVNDFGSVTTSWYPSVTKLNSNIRNVVSGSDVVTIKYASPDDNLRYPLVADMALRSGNPVIRSDHDLQIGDIALIADCYAADLFQVTATPVGGAIGHSTAAADASGNSFAPGNSSSSFRKVYNASAVISPLVTVVYYVAPGTTSPSSLWRAVLPASGATRAGLVAQEMIEGVETMQLLYGVDTNNDASPDRYSTADTVGNAADWDNVVAVKIGLLVASVDEYGLETDRVAYRVLDKIIPAKNDRRQRRVIQTALKIRN